MNQEQDHDAVLDSAVVCLRDVPVPVGPSDQTLEVVRRADVGPRTEGRNVFCLRHLVRAGAFAVLVAGGVAAYCLWSGKGIAYGEVRARILNAKGISFTATITFEGKKPEEARCVALEGGHLRFSGKHDGESFTAIVDFPKGKILAWIDSQKKAYLITEIGMNRSIYCENWLEFLKKSLGDWAQDLGEKEIDGRKAKGFRTGPPEANCTIWVDRKTGDLIRVENSTKTLTAVMTDFELDPKVAPSSFDLKAPEGYEVVETTRNVYEEELKTFRKQVTTALGVSEDGLEELLGPVLKDLPERMKKVQEGASGQQIDALCLRPPDEGLPGLIQFLGGGDEDVRLYAQSVLLNYAKFYRKKAVELFEKALGSPDGNIVGGVLQITGLNGFTELAPTIRRLVMGSSDLRLCFSGCFTLEEIEDVEGLTQIAEDHPLEKVRKCASYSLRHVKYRLLRKRATTNPANYSFLVMLDGEQAGPFDIQQIEHLAYSGRITGETPIRKQGLSAWVKAGDDPDVRDVLAVSKPSATSRPSE